MDLSWSINTRQQWGAAVNAIVGNKIRDFIEVDDCIKIKTNNYFKFSGKSFVCVCFTALS